MAATILSERVLIVEDDPRSRRQLEKIMRKMSSEVVSTGTVAQAEVLMKDPLGFDLLIVDVILPETEADAKKAAKFAEQRDRLVLDRMRHSDPEALLGPENTDDLRRQYKILEYEDEIAQHVNMRGGIELMHRYCCFLARMDVSCRLPPPCPTATLYLSARELPELQREALAYVQRGRAKWLTKPETEKNIGAAVRLVLSW